MERREFMRKSISLFKGAKQGWPLLGPVFMVRGARYHGKCDGGRLWGLVFKAGGDEGGDDFILGADEMSLF